MKGDDLFIMVILNESRMAEVDTSRGRNCIDIGRRGADVFLQEHSEKSAT